MVETVNNIFIIIFFHFFIHFEKGHIRLLKVKFLRKIVVARNTRINYWKLKIISQSLVVLK